jgi:hypothetical protein
MAKKNSFLIQQQEIRRAHFNAGLQMGRQQIIDMMSIALNDQSVMGKDTFGRERLLRLVKAVGDGIDTYQKAWERNDETDYYRAKLDEQLSKAYGNDMCGTFESRYEYCCNYDYVKGKWKR